MSVDTVREEQAIRRMTEHLVQVFTGIHTAEHVEVVVGTARHRFDGRPVRDFIPVLIERVVRQELETAARASEETPPEAVAHASQNTTADVRSDAAAGTSPDIAGDTVDSPGIHAPENSAAPRIWTERVRSKGFLSLALAAVVVVAVVVVVTTGGQESETPAAAPPPLATVRGVIGSEKTAFFEDPQVVKAFAAKGVKVEVDPAGSRQIATSIDLGRYDFAFPSSAPAADRIQRQRHVSQKYTPFSSPMAIATFQPIADLLTKAGVVKKGAVRTFDVARYLALVAEDKRWDQLAGNKVYPVRKNILVSTTDPRTSNSAAMYLAIASYVANGNTVVHGATAEVEVLPTVSKLFLRQGYTENTTEGPFDEYLAVGMGPSPLVWIYEAQFVDAAAQGRIKPGMVLTYPSPTVLSKHTLVPLNASGDKIGRLLSTDPELQRLAAEHGFRSGDASQFAKVAADHDVPVAADLIDVVDTPSYDTLEQLLDGVAKSYG
ncbi:hypothetical protein ABZ297_11770 [Nonomuraea sp. NPDC005983]|uniref:three-helix bundle dimerization domain-containing protein n=1 Tax=Nonomuraea sp. NPDC005983 TaxID=3155595 RepID=UPI0033A4B109